MDENNTIVVHEVPNAERHDSFGDGGSPVVQMGGMSFGSWQEVADWERQKEQAMGLIRRAIGTIRQLREENQSLQEVAARLRGENDLMREQMESVRRERDEIGAAIAELGRVIDLASADGHNGTGISS
jgi:predicted HNH restriction endonuclease